MSNDLKFTLRFNAETKSFIGEVKAANGAVNKLGDQSKQTSQQMKAMDTSSAALSSQLNTLKSRAIGLAGGFSVLFAASNAKNTLAAYQDIRTQISALVGGQEAWAETEQYLKTVSAEHNKVLTDMTGNYARLVSLQDSGLLTQREVRDIFEGMSNAQSQTGASTTQLEQSMYGLSQALASPIVRAEELNQVVEPLPGLLNKLDKAAGLQAGGFRQMMLAGQVTSEMFKTTLVKALDEYQGAAARTADNINAKEAELITSYQNVVTAFETPISDSYTTVLDGLSDSLDLIADNADLVSDAVGITLFAAIGRSSAAIYESTRAKVSNIAADRQKLQATVATTQAELTATQAEIRHLETMQLSNNQKFRAIGAETTLSALRAREAAATDTLTAAQTRLNIVSRASTAVMGVLGGPAGIIMAAVGALSYFAFQAGQAETATSDLQGELNDLVKEFNSVNEQGRVSMLHQLGTEASTARTALIKTQQKIRELKTDLVYLDPDQRSIAKQQIADLESGLVSLESQVDASSQKFDALFKASTDGKWIDLTDEGTENTPPVSADAEKSAERMLENLTRQAALYGKKSELAKVNYEIESGALKGINADLAEQLRLQAQLLDTKRAADEEPKTDKIDTYNNSSDELERRYREQLAVQADYENRAQIQENFAYSDRRSQLQAQYDEAYAQAENNNSLQLELAKQFAKDKETLKLEHEAILTSIEEDASKQRLENETRQRAQQLNAVSNWMGQLSELQDSENKKAAAVGRTAARVQIMINTYEMATKSYNALASIPYVGPALGAAAAATAIAYGMAQYNAVGSLSGQAHDGIDRVPKSNEGTWMLKADEMVLNPAQADNFRWMVDMMSQMKTMQAAAVTSAAGSVAAGGMPVSINVSGVDKSQVTSTAQVKDGQLQINMVIKQAVDASMAAMYQDADNGGPVSTRIKQG